MKNLTWQNPGQLFVAQELIKIVKLKCCGIKALYKSVTLQVNAGVQNIFEAYQSDFDQGKDRDSKYIYGPGMPRSYFVGCKISY